MHQTLPAEFASRLPHSFSSFFSLKGLGTRLVVNIMEDSETDSSRYQTVRESLLAGKYGIPALPELVVDKIMEDARNWDWVSKETREVREVCDSRQSYLSLEVPAACRQVKLVALECESQDQGWSDFFDDHGTRRNSWTWGDLTVMNSEEVEEYKQDRVYTNLHASESWELHTKEYSASDQLVKHLATGKSLVLSLNAMFPGWENHVKYAKLTVYFV